MHINYLKSLETMLALPVERLIGSNSGTTLTPTASLSPDSTTSTSSTEDNNGDNNECKCVISAEANNNNSPTMIKVEREEEPMIMVNRKSDKRMRPFEADGEDVTKNKRPLKDHPRHEQQEEGEDSDIDVDGDCDHGLNLAINRNAITVNNKSNSSSLKFSIDDILRPDFGLSKFQLLAQQHQIMMRNKTKSKNGPCSVSSSEGHPPYRPEFSEDSNGSCTSKTSRGTGNGLRGEAEVVDDQKVNPPVPEGPLLWPAWVYCTRYSDRPSSGPRSRRIRKSPREVPEEKRPRTAFTSEQLARLKHEFEENRYLTEKRRQDLANELKLHENQIKIWFQNKRAKLKKSTGTKNGLALQLMAQGLYNHSTVPVDEDDELMMEMM